MDGSQGLLKQEQQDLPASDVRPSGGEIANSTLGVKLNSTALVICRKSTSTLVPGQVTRCRAGSTFPSTASGGICPTAQSRSAENIVSTSLSIAESRHDHAVRLRCATPVQTLSAKTSCPQCPAEPPRMLRAKDTSQKLMPAQQNPW